MTSPLESAAPSATHERLIEAARHELAHGGVRAMSFRRLAGALGVTPGALTYQLGAKARILEDVVRGERARERAWSAEWLALIGPLERLDAEAVALILEHFLESATRGEARVTQLIWAELMLRAPRDADAAALVRPWLAERRAFWAELFDGRIDEAPAWAGLAAAYLADETVHSLASGGRADYRLLRRLAIGRLANRLNPERRGGLGRDAVFADLVRRLDPGLDLPGRDAESDLLRPGRRRDLALAACGVLLDDGADAVTHRAVAEQAGVPASTVAYHFRAAPELLRAGLAMVYLVAQGRAPAPEPDTPERRSDVVVRGTLTVALAAARDPALQPAAIDLRRLRGENLVHILRDRGCARIDALDGQAASLAAIGAGALAGIEGRDGREPLIDWLTAPLKG